MFCKDVRPGKARVVKCLMEAMAKPSFGAECRAELRERAEVVKSDYRRVVCVCVCVCVCVRARAGKGRAGPTSSVSPGQLPQSQPACHVRKRSRTTYRMPARPKGTTSASSKTAPTRSTQSAPTPRRSCAAAPPCSSAWWTSLRTTGSSARWAGGCGGNGLAAGGWCSTILPGSRALAAVS